MLSYNEFKSNQILLLKKAKEILKGTDNMPFTKDKFRSFYKNDNDFLNELNALLLFGFIKTLNMRFFVINIDNASRIKNINEFIKPFKQTLTETKQAIAELEAIKKYINKETGN